MTGPTLAARNGRRDSVRIQGARVVDPVGGIDAVLDVTVKDGTVAALDRRARRLERRDRSITDRDVEDGVDPLARVDDARALDPEAVAASVSAREDHATSSSSTAAGPCVRRS